MKPETIAGLAMLGAAAFGAATDTRTLDRPPLERARVMADVSAWPGWATVAGLGLLYVGSRGGRK